MKTTKKPNPNSNAALRDKVRALNDDVATWAKSNGELKVEIAVKDEQIANLQTSLDIVRDALNAKREKEVKVTNQLIEIRDRLVNMTDMYMKEKAEVERGLRERHELIDTVIELSTTLKEHRLSLREERSESRKKELLASLREQAS